MFEYYVYSLHSLLSILRIFNVKYIFVLTRSNYCDSPDQDRGTCYLVDVDGSLASDTASN